MLIENLEKRLKELEKVAICYSGGIDSSFLLLFANKVLPKENVLGIIANGQMLPQKDCQEAIDFLKENNLSYIEIDYNPLEIQEFKQNRKDRCYHCKKSLMSKIIKKANEQGFKNILDGTNQDDTKTYRPGIKAKKELNIISPLEEIGFTKENIREEAKKIGITFWNKPSNSCLATRFPYDTTLTEENLKKVDQAETLIKTLGIPKTRLRVHGDIARIEVEEKYFDLILENKTLPHQIKSLGFKHITLDLEGIKSGSFDA